MINIINAAVYLIYYDINEYEIVHPITNKKMSFDIDIPNSFISLCKTIEK